MENRLTCSGERGIYPNITKKKGKKNGVKLEKSKAPDLGERTLLLRGREPPVGRKRRNTKRESGGFGRGRKRSLTRGRITETPNASKYAS